VQTYINYLLPYLFARANRFIAKHGSGIILIEIFFSKIANQILYLSEIDCLNDDSELSRDGNVIRDPIR